MHQFEELRYMQDLPQHMTPMRTPMRDFRSFRHAIKDFRQVARDTERCRESPLSAVNFMRDTDKSILDRDMDRDFLLELAACVQVGMMTNQTDSRLAPFLNSRFARHSFQLADL